MEEEEEEESKEEDRNGEFIFKEGVEVGVVIIPGVFIAVEFFCF